MIGAAVHVLVSPLIAAWLAIATRSWRRLPTPGERSRSSAVGPNADRVLLVGAGIAVGYGVTSPDLTLGGHLARTLARRTHRGASVETVARFGFRAKHGAEVLNELDLDRFDTLILTVGTDEALTLVTVAEFRFHVEALLEWLDERAPRRLGIVIVGVPDITSIMVVPLLIRRSVRQQCRRLDSELRRLSGLHARATYAPFVPARFDLERDGGPRVYAAWAELIAPTISRVLDAQAVDPRDPATLLEHRRQRALDDLHILDTEREPRFDRIVASACALFGVTGASITFIDRDRQWSKATVGLDTIDSPRGSALGDATVQNGKLLVVQDAALDERFRGHPWVAGSSRVRFFAGFPIESADGERIGALCLTDQVPRTFSPADDALLGDLARQVQSELWGAGSTVEAA